jgi:putative transposase
MRKSRELREGARYHVTARANRKEMILDSGACKELFLSVLRRAKGRYSFRIENFTIMGNHFHLVIEPGKGESLSSIMQWILSVFAMAFNRSHGYTGHVWGARFFSRIIDSLRDLIEVFEYIDGNAVNAGRVDDRRDWRYCGLWHSRNGRREILGEATELIKMLFPERGVSLLPCPAIR